MPRRRSKTAKADIKIRLTEELRSKIEKAARVSGASMNAEMIQRLDRSFDWDIARTTAQQWLAESRAIADGELETALSRNGYTRISGIPGGIYWASPDADLEKINLALDPDALVAAMQPDLVQALARALGKFAKSRGQK